MARAQKPLINVGLVVEAAPDGGMREALAEEVGALMEREFDVRFSSEYTVNTDGTVDGARQALALLYRATAVDLVIAGGPVVSQVAITEYAAGAPSRRWHRWFCTPTCRARRCRTSRAVSPT